jgi:ADP-heptose:LPS heptosyltransferase
MGGSGFKIGLVWAAKTTNEHERSCPLEKLLPLLIFNYIQIYGLQKGEDAFQVNNLPADVINLGPEFETFADTAGAIECLDLVISVDTAVAHLAGAMGKPVWLLLPFAADWKWLMERQDSPWYPTMRLFRQRQPGDWDAVVSMVAAELRQFLIGP